MVKTTRLPASAMRSPADRSIDVVGRNWSLVPGSASQVAVGFDGSLWALSTQPAGPDKYIWHYVSGTWTNIPGLASQIAGASDGSLWVINSAGGVYHYSGGSWSSPGGGARSIGTQASGNNIFVTSNGGSGPDYPIWEYAGGFWQQWGGAGVAVSGNPDGNQYPLATGAIGNNPGTFILNAQGNIWYENGGASFSFGSLPGAASALSQVPSQHNNGGVFALGYPANSAGNTIYYYNFYMPGWVTESGAGTSISTDGAALYTVGGSGAIYRTTAQGLIFAAGSTSTTFTPSGGSYSTPTSGSYNNVSVTMTWGANTSPASFPVAVNWAYGSDLPGPFVALPATIGTPLIYLDIVAGPGVAATFSLSPAVNVTTTTAFPGTKCGFAIWGKVASGPGAPTWISMTAVGIPEVTPSGSSFSIPSTSPSNGATIDMRGGQDQYLSLYCH